MTRENELWYPKARYIFAINAPERVEMKKPYEGNPNWTVEVFEKPEEVSLWLLAMGLVNDVDELTRELKKWEYCFMPGPQFAGFDRLPDHIVTDLGKEMIKDGDRRNRYGLAWDEWKNFRATVEAINARKRLGSKPEDDS